MALAEMSRIERKQLAVNPETDPEVLAELTLDVLLIPDLVKNPSTPQDTREAIYAVFPHLRPDAQGGVRPQAAVRPVVPTVRRTEADDALDRMRRRYEGAPPVSSPAPPSGTNGFAIVSLVLALVGGNLLAVIFGHAAHRQIDRDGGSGAGLATAGLVIGYGSMAYLVIFVLFPALASNGT